MRQWTTPKEMALIPTTWWELDETAVIEIHWKIYAIRYMNKGRHYTFSSFLSPKRTPCADGWEARIEKDGREQTFKAQDMNGFPTVNNYGVPTV